MTLSDIISKTILAHAEAVAPNECCGFIVSDHMDGLTFYYPCQNVADDPENYFEISPDEFIEAEKLGEIVAVVHSHPNGEPTLSIADRQMQDLLGLDFWLSAPASGGRNLMIGDVILMQVGADVPNHAGIYLGEQMVLHHSPKRLSKRDLYDGYWLKHTHSIWRMNEWHLSQLDFTVALNHLARNLA